MDKILTYDIKGIGNRANLYAYPTDQKKPLPLNAVGVFLFHIKAFGSGISAATNLTMWLKYGYAIRQHLQMSCSDYTGNRRPEFSLF